jgi:hypothetical protein
LETQSGIISIMHEMMGQREEVVLLKWSREEHLVCIGRHLNLNSRRILFGSISKPMAYLKEFYFEKDF